MARTSIHQDMHPAADLTLLLDGQHTRRILGDIMRLRHHPLQQMFHSKSLERLKSRNFLQLVSWSLITDDWHG